jgi:DNA-binding SARP family transcriptional activator
MPSATRNQGRDQVGDNYKQPTAGAADKRSRFGRLAQLASDGGPTAAEVFDDFPFGILVASEDGTILAANRCATQMLGPVVGAPGTEPRCCELLGCGRPDGPLDGICMTSLAQQTDTAIPEIRTDLPNPRGVGAVWVTAVRAGSYVIFNLRPGERRDRRSRTNPHWIAGPHLRIFTLGHTRIESREGPIEGKWLKQRPGQLLKFLITNRERAVHPEEIAHALWPQSGPEAVGSVRQFVHAVRERLEPQRKKGTPSSFILAPGGGYRLSTANVSVDADHFEAHVTAAHAALRDGDPDRGAAHAKLALELYHGDYLHDEPYAEWAFIERERLRQLAGSALRMLGEIHLERGNVDGAASAWRRLAELDPFDLEVQRELIRLCVHAGHRGEALRRYATLRQLMLREFGEGPDFELVDLVESHAPPGRRRAT